MFTKLVSRFPLSLLMFLLLSCACNNHLTSDYETIQNNESRNEDADTEQQEIQNMSELRITSFSLSFESFKNFIANPSLDNLQNSSHQQIVYAKSETEDSIIVMGTGVWNSTYESPDGYERIGSMMVTIELLDFICDHSNFDAILQSNGVDDKTLAVNVIDYDSDADVTDELVAPGTYSTMGLWIHTELGDYLLEHSVALTDDPHDTAFTYEFHDLQMEGEWTN